MLSNSEMLAIVLLAVGIAVLALAIKHPILVKLGVRNLPKRKGHTLIIIGGLMMSSAIISSSFVVGDTMEYVFTGEVYESWGHVDEQIVSFNADTDFGDDFFNYSMYEDLEPALGANENIDAYAPAIVQSMPIIHFDTRQLESDIFLIGVHQQFTGFGEFISTGDAVVSVPSLAPDEAIMNERLAVELEAAVGDVVTIYNGYVPHNLTLTAIVRDDGPANYRKAESVFVQLSTAQTILGKPDMINIIMISNAGGIEGGELLTPEVYAAVSDELYSLAIDNLYVDSVKQNDLSDALFISEFLTEIFLILGSFCVVAGIMLVMNIFILMAEERKSEMGVSRAIGLKRAHLTQMFMFEGMSYTVIASSIGAVLGLGIAYLMIWLFNMMASVAFIEGQMAFHFEYASIWLGFALGTVITFITVIIVSGRISRLNVVRAIRNIDEPPLIKLRLRELVFGALILLGGISGSAYGIIEENMLLVTAAPCIAALGAGLLLIGRTSLRVIFTSVGIFVLAWILQPFEIIQGNVTGLEIFVVTGILLVGAAILIVMFNSSVILGGLLRVFGRRKKLVPVLKIAITYPMKKQIRTGITLAMFSLVIFTITIISMVSAMQTEYVTTALDEQSGGYEIVANVNPLNPIFDIDARIRNSNYLDAADFESHGSIMSIPVDAKTGDMEEAEEYLLMSVGQDFVDNNGFTFYEYDTAYGSERDVWQAVAADPTLAIVDGSSIKDQIIMSMGTFELNIGDTLQIRTVQNNVSEVTIIGILDELLIPGIFVGSDFANQSYGWHTPNFYMFDLVYDADAELIGANMEREFIQHNIETIVIGSQVKEIMNTANTIMRLLQLYLGLGLLIGISGLGIITMRSIVERRKEIGVLRAIGFKRSMVLKAFLLEISFIALMGIFIGIFLGIALSYDLHIQYFGEQIDFIIPWVDIILITAIAYAATILATFWPAHKGSKIAPAEALRFKG